MQSAECRGRGRGQRLPKANLLSSLRERCAPPASEELRLLCVGCSFLGYFLCCFFSGINSYDFVSAVVDLCDGVLNCLFLTVFLVDSVDNAAISVLVTGGCFLCGFLLLNVFVGESSCALCGCESELVAVEIVLGKLVDSRVKHCCFSLKSYYIFLFFCFGFNT